ncbi:MAG TPA: DUF2339 domain-containing protein [Lacunisphaera sp.]|jgi:hypothetical protein|nr:DUF2339 domain-containing protein [Lacunisphaera sp.]
MEALLVLLALYLFAVLVILPIWIFVKFGNQQSTLDALQRELDELRDEVLRFRQSTASPPAATPPQAESAPARPASAMPSPMVATAIPPPPAVITPAPPTTVPSPPLDEDEGPPLIVPETETIAAPPRPVAVPPVYTPPTPEPGWLESINWEQFMGAKLFAWLGGLALFLGVAFFVKYSFDHDLIPPAVRVAIGFIVGAGLVVGGLRIDRARYRITAQTLIAAGIVSLYAVTFACRSIYHFEFFGPVPTLLLMALITTTAFVLAVRLEAQVVAILGVLGGFLTPSLLSTGVNNPVGLFGYIALLDLGLVAVALHRSWFHLVPLGATGTVIMLLGWTDRFYAPEKSGTAMIVCLGFSALFFAAREAARRLERDHAMLAHTAAALPAVAFCYAWFILGQGPAAAGAGLLFGFVFLTGFFVLALAWRESRGGLVASAAGATALLLVRWAALQFDPAQAGTIVALCLSFSAFYFGVYLLARRFDRATPAVLASAIVMPALSLGFALFLAEDRIVGARPGLLLGFMLAADLLLLAPAWLDERLPRLHLIAGLGVFILLGVWLALNLTDALLPWSLAATLVFAGLHTAFPLVLERRRPAAAPTWWSQLFPPLALLLLLGPLFKLETVSFLLWPAMLLVDLIAIALAVVSASLAGIAVVLVLTLAAAGAWVFKVPVTAGVPFGLIVVIGFFAVFFFAASLWLVRRLGPRFPAAAGAHPALAAVFGDTRAQVPAFASLLPFLLLIMASGRLDLPDPTAVFGLGLLLVALTLGLARLLMIDWLPACALAGAAGLEFAWHAGHFTPAAAVPVIFWYLGFYAVFTVYPFAFRRVFLDRTGPWAVAALAGVAHFPLVYRLVKAASPSPYLGVLPALFAVPPLISLIGILKTVPVDHPRRLNQLAWFGGTALFFITLIFPIQFERQWLTVAWALEGAALLWLFHRVPHPGLRATGAVLLVVAFVRLALNPAVLGYQVRGGAILNWYLYAYGLSLAALFVGARLAAPPRERVLGVNLPPLFNTLGTILAFLLLNLEIADFFTPPGVRSVTFQFSGNFARDMSYTIGWALFALGLLAAGLWRGHKAARYAAIALLSVALLKLFFHDLARLEALYRIGALFAVAVIAILASFAYQRFLPSNENSAPPPS